MDDENPKQDRNSKSYNTPLAKEESLVCEALVREIGRAQRWSAVMDGWEALLHVRHTADAMHLEARKFEKAEAGGAVVDVVTDKRYSPRGHGGISEAQ